MSTKRKFKNLQIRNSEGPIYSYEKIQKPADLKYPCQYCKESHPIFTVITGNEPYKVIDLATNGETFFTCKIEAYQMCSVIKNVLNHDYRIECRPA